MTCIALIGPVFPFRGGISHYTSHLSSHLIDKGIEVSIFSFRRQYPAWLYPGVSDRDPSFEPLRSKAKFILDPIYPWTWDRCAKEIIQFKPDLVIIPWWTTFWAPAFSRILILLKHKGVRTIILVHNVIPHESKPWDRILTRMALSQTENFIVQTEAQKNILHIFFPKIKVKLAPHPVYDEFPGKRIDPVTARNRLKIPQGRQILLFMGIIRKYKGLQLMIKAMQVLKSMNSAIHLVVAGEFWEPIEEYQMQISELQLHEHITIFPGYIPNEDIPLFLSAANLLVAPYTAGTQSGMVKLAMGFGTPVVISRQITDKLLESYEGKGVTISDMRII